MSDSPDEIESAFPTSCAFCRIASAYPESKSSTSASRFDAIPLEHDSDSQKISPSCFLILNTREVMAFLDIMPITPGHVLLATRQHRRRIGEVTSEEGREIGWWLPVLARVVAKVTGCADYNVVQNNGLRAAQVVPHVHFHLIPRPGDRTPQISNRSWTMFGRGTRQDLDEEEAGKIAREMREELRRETKRLEGRRSAM